MFVMMTSTSLDNYYMVDITNVTDQDTFQCVYLYLKFIFNCLLICSIACTFDHMYFIGSWSFGVLMWELFSLGKFN